MGSGRKRSLVLMRLGTVSGDDRFHKASVKILQRVAWSMPQTSGALSDLRPDKREPDIARYSHLGSQSRCGTAWMRLQKMFYIIFYDVRKLFDVQCDHN
jgi:hypothetical protein